MIPRLRHEISSIAYFGLIGSLLFVCSCKNNNEALTSAQQSDVRQNVLQLTNSIASDVSHNGPIAWTRYFEDSPGFFMASDGNLVFPDNDSANRFIRNTLVKIMPVIKLRWSNIRVDPLTLNLAGIGANYQEDITDSGGNTTSYKGYFSAIGHRTGKGWKLRNAHWSVKSGN